MKVQHFKTFSMFSVTLLWASQVSFAACDQTLSPGANVTSAISSAAAGTTICLNAGSYGTVSLINIAKTSDVTVQSASGKSASVSFTVGGSNHLTFQNLTISGLNMWKGGNKNISVLNNTFTGQLLVTGSGTSATPAGILIDGNAFDGISVGPNGYEGRLQMYDGGGVTVSNNHFGNGGESDGIQMGGYGGTIGPGNVFDSIRYSGGRHVDAIQLYGEGDHPNINGNYFTNGGSYIMAPDGANAVTISNNVFVVGDYYPAVQLGSHSGDTFVHNTSAPLHTTALRHHTPCVLGSVSQLSAPDPLETPQAQVNREDRPLMGSLWVLS